MIRKEITNENGTFTIIIHSATSVAIRNENLTIRNIPYTANTCYDVKDMIFTENYRYVSRRDTYTKEPTYDQKNRACDVLKREVFDFIFSNPELLKEAQKSYVNGRMQSLRKDRELLLTKAAEKQTEINEFWEANRGVFEA